MEGDVFHITNRGVEKRDIFLTDKDYKRCAYSLYDFNTHNNALAHFRRRSIPLEDVRRPTEEIVDVLCWTLMKNHIHLLVREKIDGGSSLFSQKVIGGHTKYFNELNKRSGVLFQGRSKIIPVRNDGHFEHLPFYIMANPISFIEPQWREKGIKNVQKVLNFIENYKYSSLSDLTGKEKFAFVINKTAFYELFDTNEKQLKKDFIEWLKDM